MKEKKNLKNRGLEITAALIVIALIGLIAAGWHGYRLFQTEEAHTLATELKLNVYYAIDEAAERAIISGDTEKTRDWGIRIVNDVLSTSQIELSREEKARLEDEMTKLLASTYSSGSISIDEDGALTDLSKSYISNSIADALFLVKGEADMNAAVDAGTTIYRQVVSLNDTIGEMKKTQERFDEVTEKVNELSAFMGEISGNEEDMENMRTLMEAIRTNLELSAYVVKSSAQQPEASVSDDPGASAEAKTVVIREIESAPERGSDTALSDSVTRLEKNVKSAQDAISALNKEQTQQMEKLEQALAQIDAQAALFKTDDGSTEAFQSQIAAVSETLASAQSELAVLKSGIEAAKQELQQELTKNQEQERSSREELDKTMQEKSDDIAKLSTLIQTAAQRQDAMESRMNEYSAMLDRISGEIQGADQQLSDSFGMSLGELRTELAAVQELLTEQDARLSAQEMRTASQETRLEELSLGMTQRMEQMEMQASQRMEQMETQASQRMEALEESLDEVSGKRWIEMLDGFSIAASGEADYHWADGADGASVYVEIEDEELIDCSHIQILYADAYNILPHYTLDVLSGILRIELAELPEEEIRVEGVLIYDMEEEPYDMEEYEDEYEDE